MWLSYTLDTLSLYPETWNGLNFTYLSPLGRALGPAYIRLGGTYSDFIIFNETNNGPLYVDPPNCILNGILPNGYCSIFTGQQLDAIYSFTQSAGFRLVYCLNIMLRNGTHYTKENISESAWDPTNTIQIMRYAQKNGYIFDWEFGNEPDGFFYANFFKGIYLSMPQLALDFKAFRALNNADPWFGNNNSIIVGPSISGINPFLDNFTDVGGLQYVDAATAHHYYMGDDGQFITHYNDFLNVTVFDNYMGWIVAYKHSVKNFRPMWNGETSSASGDGIPELSNRFIAGFLWLDKLGLSATHDVDMVIRQAFVGAGGPNPWGNYSLINRALHPLPDYWLTFLYKRLVGQTVYNVTFSPAEKNLRLYGSSNKNNNGYVLYGQYVLNNSFTIDIPQLANKQVTLYVLKEGTLGNLQSNLTRINGQLIDWDAHQATNIQGNSTTLPITLPGYSLFYIVVPPQISLTSCPTGFQKENTNPNKCIKIIDSFTHPWFAANVDCSTYGVNSSLLAIESAFENTEINGLLQSHANCSSASIGLYRNANNWSWSNGNIGTYRNFKAGYPTNDMTQNCGSFLNDNSLQWINSDCDVSRCYICQLYIQ